MKQRLARTVDLSLVRIADSLGVIARVGVEAQYRDTAEQLAMFTTLNQHSPFTSAHHPAQLVNKPTSRPKPGFPLLSG